MSDVEVVGHGGAGDFYPGNSRQSLEKALELGVDRIEIDVQLAAGGQLVLVHDDALLINGQKLPVRQLRLEQIREALDGLLTLDEAIALTRGTCPLMIDLKSPGYERLLVETIVAAGIAAETIVASTHALSLQAVRRSAPGVSIGLSSGHALTVTDRKVAISFASHIVAAIAPLPIIAVAKLIHADHLMLNYRICSPRFIRAAHRAGLTVYAWTVNQPGTMRKLIRDGVDGLISDRPDLVRELLGISGTAVPGPSLPGTREEC